MAEKFTFKKEPRETGLRAVGNPNSNTIIKHNKMEVGYISGPNWQSKDDSGFASQEWIVSLMVLADGIIYAPTDPRIRWDWKTLKRKFDDEPSAREYLNENAEKILGLGLHHMENE